MGSSHNPIDMPIADSTDPWLDKMSNCWPLEEQHYADVFAVSASYETDNPSLWRGLLTPSARAAALRETGVIASTVTETLTPYATVGITLSTPAAV